MAIALGTASPGTPDEITRVRHVYREYAERGRGARERAPDHPGNRAMVDERNFRVGNPRNPHVRGTSRRLGELFPGWHATLRLVTLLPPLARRLHRLTPVLYPVLAALPPLRTHLLELLEHPR